MDFNRVLKKKNGFTLIELLVVIAIIAILAVVAVPALFKNINKSKIAEVESDYNAIKSSMLSYYAEKNNLPKDIKSLDVDGIVDNDKTPIGGIYKLISKDDDFNIKSSNNRIAAYKLKPTGEIDFNPDDEDKEADGSNFRIYLENYGDVFLALQGQPTNNLYINSKQFKKLIEDIGYENIYISSPPEGTGYQTGEIYIRLANNILPKPNKSFK